MRVVFDTSVWVSALLWRGTPHRLLRAAESGRFKLVASEATLAELQEVLERPKFRARLLACSTTSSEVLVSILETVDLVEAGSARRTSFPRLRDLDDGIFLSLASAAGARYLVSGDRHLLELGSWGGCRIVLPAEAVRELGIR